LHGERILDSGMAFPPAIIEFIYRKCGTLRQLFLCKGGEVLNILFKLGVPPENSILELE